MAYLIEKPIENYSIDPSEYKARFVKLWRDNVFRDGSDKFLRFLEQSDFFTAPASTKYHGNVRGGLCYHSLLVLREMEADITNAGVNITPALRESMTIAALAHDVCKVNFYKWDSRNVKDEHGTWHAVPNITIDEVLPFGHGEKSVYIIQSFMNLSREEALAIRWHMGDFTEAYGGCTKAFSMCPFALYLHIADLKASSLYERTYDYIKDEWSNS